MEETVNAGTSSEMKRDLQNRESHSSIPSLFWLLEFKGRWHANWNEDANTLSMKFFQLKGQCKLFTDSEEAEQIIGGREKEENKNILNVTVHNFTEKAMATHSSTLAWKIPWTEEPGGLQSMGSLGVRHDWATSLSLFTFHFHALEKEMGTHSSVLAWRIPETAEPGGLPSLGSHRVGHDWSNLAAAAVHNFTI